MLPGDEAGHVVLDLPFDVASVGLARWSVTRLLASRDGETRFKVELLVSELVTNAIRHSDAWVIDTIGVRVAADEERVRVEVSDPGRAEVMIQPIQREGFEPAGFGLWLVDRLADEWGVDQSQGAVTVWFEVVDGALPPSLR